MGWDGIVSSPSLDAFWSAYRYPHSLADLQGHSRSSALALGLQVTADPVRD